MERPFSAACLLDTALAALGQRFFSPTSGFISLILLHTIQSFEYTRVPQQPFPYCAEYRVSHTKGRSLSLKQSTADHQRSSALIPFIRLLRILFSQPYILDLRLSSNHLLLSLTIDALKAPWVGRCAIRRRRNNPVRFRRPP